MNSLEPIDSLEPINSLEPIDPESTQPEEGFGDLLSLIAIAAITWLIVIIVG